MNQLSEEQLLGGYTGRLFAVMSLGWLGFQIGRSVLPPLLPAIMEDLVITPVQAGAALTVLWATYSLFHFPGGRLADQLSRKTVLIGGLLAVCIGFLLLSVAFAYPVFLISATIIGAGSGFFFIAMRSATADLFVEKRAQAFGIQTSFGNVGAAASAGIAVAALAIGSWRSPFLPLAAFFALVILLAHKWSRERYILETVEIGVLDTGKRVFGTVTSRRTLLAYVLVMFAWQGMINFLPTFLQADKGLSTTWASVGFAVIYVTGIGIGPLAGIVGDRIQKLPVAAGAVLFMTCGLLIITSFSSPLAIGIALVIFAVGFWSFPPVMQAYLMGTFADDSMASDLGAFKTIYSGIGSLGPTYIGIAASWWSYTAAYTGLIGCLLVSLFLLILIWYTGT